jgi:hypothetical protein
MRIPTRPALCAAAVALLLACSAKGVKETREASKLAVRELQGLVDDGIERGLKEREAARSEEALDFAAISAAAVQRFTALPEARALRNPYSAGRPVFVVGPEGREPGTVYLDATSAASGAILVTAVFQDGAAVKREAASVKVNVAARPKKIDVDTGAMPAAPGL